MTNILLALWYLLVAFAAVTMCMVLSIAIAFGIVYIIDLWRGNIK